MTIILEVFGASIIISFAIINIIVMLVYREWDIRFWWKGLLR
jgi:hypothetical protein